VALTWRVLVEMTDEPDMVRCLCFSESKREPVFCSLRNSSDEARRKSFCSRSNFTLLEACPVISVPAAVDGSSPFDLHGRRLIFLSLQFRNVETKNHSDKCVAF